MWFRLNETLWLNALSCIARFYQSWISTSIGTAIRRVRSLVSRVCSSRAKFESSFKKYIYVFLFFLDTFFCYNFCCLNDLTVVNSPVKSLFYSHSYMWNSQTVHVPRAVSRISACQIMRTGRRIFVEFPHKYLFNPRQYILFKSFKRFCFI